MFLQPILLTDSSPCRSSSWLIPLRLCITPQRAAYHVWTTLSSNTSLSRRCSYRVITACTCTECKVDRLAFDAPSATTDTNILSVRSRRLTSHIRSHCLLRYLYDYLLFCNVLHCCIINKAQSLPKFEMSRVAQQSKQITLEMSDRGSTKQHTSTTHLYKWSRLSICKEVRIFSKFADFSSLELQNFTSSRISDFQFFSLQLQLSTWYCSHIPFDALFKFFFGTSTRPFLSPIQRPPSSDNQSDRLHSLSHRKKEAGDLFYTIRGDFRHLKGELGGPRTIKPLEP